MANDSFPHERRTAPSAEESLALIAHQMNLLRRRLDEHEQQSSELISVTRELKDVADARRAISIGSKFVLWASSLILAIFALHEALDRFTKGSL